VPLAAACCVHVPYSRPVRRIHPCTLPHPACALKSPHPATHARTHTPAPRGGARHAARGTRHAACGTRVEHGEKEEMRGLTRKGGRAGRPLPPPATELLAPIPPYTAPDNRDPNWKLRIQVFKQVP